MSTRLAIRSVHHDFTSKNGFRWPAKTGAVVTAPDWKNTAECGNGLHALLCGQNAPGEWYDGPILVVEPSQIVDLVGKIKFPSCVIRHIGDMASASAYMAQHGQAEGLYRRSAIGGDYSTLTGGDHSTLTGGYHSTLTGGAYSTLTGGAYSTLTGGTRSMLTGGNCSTLTGGYGSTLTGHWYDGNRRRIATVYVGEGGIEPNVTYRFDCGVFTKVELEDKP